MMMMMMCDKIEGTRGESVCMFEKPAVCRRVYNVLSEFLLLCWRKKIKKLYHGSDELP